MAQSQVSTQIQPVSSQLWWSDKGRKMSIDKLDRRAGFLRIANGEVASIKITAPKNEHREWRIFWTIQHATGSAMGHVLLDAHALRGAFDITKYYLGEDDFILKQFEGDEALQGVFIRHGNRLNIPGPGLPWQGGGTVSVLLNDDIQRTVRLLVAAWEK